MYTYEFRRGITTWVAKVNNDELPAIVDADPSQTTDKLAALFDAIIPTVRSVVCSILVKNIIQFVPHELFELQLGMHIESLHS